MINEILSLFDEALHNKCWIDIYGRLAITGKQSVAGKFKKFPVSTDVIMDDCEDLTQFFNTLIPDDRKTGVAFWKTLSKPVYSDVQGISWKRRIKKVETIVQFVCWLNVKKISGITDKSNWGSAVNGIMKDAYKTLSCRNMIQDTGVDGITNLTVTVVGMDGIESWRQAMSEYSIDNIEAISVWPYAGFTINCRLSFLVRGDCLDAFSCETEIMCNETFYITDENNNAIGDSNLIIQ